MIVSAETIRRIDERRDRLLEDLRLLVEAESGHDDEAALARCADVVESVGERLLGESPVRRDCDGVPHLQWESRGTPVVALIGHFDTVWPSGTVAQRPFTVAGDWAFGPGVLDMKAGIVQGFAALSEVGLHGVTLVLTGDEETGSLTSRGLIENVARSVEAVLVLEPAAGEALKTARKGVATYAIEVVGRAAHAGLDPENGVNATLAMAEAATAAAALSDRARGTTVTPTVASAGSATNVVPSRALVHIDVRAWTTTELERVDAGLRSLRPAVPGAQLAVERRYARPPLEEHHTRELFGLAQRVSVRLGLGDLNGVGVGGGSDGMLAAGVGAQTLDGLGAVGVGVHADDERVYIPALAPRTALVAALIEAVRTRDPEGALAS